MRVLAAILRSLCGYAVVKITQERFEKMTPAGQAGVFLVAGLVGLVELAAEGSAIVRAQSEGEMWRGLGEFVAPTEWIGLHHDHRSVRAALVTVLLPGSQRESVRRLVDALIDTERAIGRSPERRAVYASLMQNQAVPAEGGINPVVRALAARWARPRARIAS